MAVSGSDWIARKGASAAAAPAPDVPDYVENFYDEYERPYVGRYIVGFAGIDPCRKTGHGSGETTLDIKHNNLEEIQGGDAGSGRWHLTKEQHDAVINSKASGDNPFATMNDLPVVPTPTDPTDVKHNGLEGLQGGDTEKGEFYHLTLAQREAALNANNPSGDNPFATMKDMPTLGKNVADWKLMDKPWGTGTLYAAAYWDGMFAAVGDGCAVYSLDGESWLEAVCPDGHWRGVACGGGTFAALGLNGKAMHSQDGINWTEATAPSGDWNAICFGNGMFIGVSDGKAVKSIDGRAAWTARAVPAGYGEDVFFGNGIFYAVGNNGVMTSRDGENWTPGATPGATWRCGAYSDGAALILAGKAAVSSDDGLTWTEAPVPSGGWDAVEYGSGFFVAVGNSAQCMISPAPAHAGAALDWEQSSVPNFIWRGLAFGNDTFVAVGSGIMAAKVTDVAAALDANAPSAANPFATMDDVRKAIENSGIYEMKTEFDLLRESLYWLGESA